MKVTLAILLSLWAFVAWPLCAAAVAADKVDPTTTGDQEACVVSHTEHETTEPSVCCCPVVDERPTCPMRDGSSEERPTPCPCQPTPKVPTLVADLPFARSVPKPDECGRVLEHDAVATTRALLPPRKPPRASV